MADPVEPGEVGADALRFIGPGVRLHHLGIACKSIAADSAGLEILGFKREGEDFDDPRQGIKGRFLVGPGVRFELLEDLPGHATLVPWLASRTRIYHQAYLADDLDTSLAHLVEAGARVTRPPMPAVAFSGRRVVFAMLPQMMLVELIEAPVGD
jgi:methylmalonyl-CoA/ethylmalonyl-CoA epimerase